MVATSRLSTLASWCALALLASSSTATAKLEPVKREYDSHTYYVLELDPSQLPSATSPHDVALALGAEHVERVGELDNHFLIRAPKDVVARGEDAWELHHAATLARRSGSPVERDLVMERYALLGKGRGPAKRLHARRGPGSSPAHSRLSRKAVLSLERQQPRLRVKRDRPIEPPGFSPRAPPNAALVGAQAGEQSLITTMAKEFDIIDPLWSKQWHLVNGLVEENSINVTGVWSEGILGQGINVAMVDDGLDMHSDDLAANFHAEGSWDYNDNTALPEPRLSDDQHGTRCAGEIAAVKNDVCGVGVAHKAGIAGIRILSASISDADEASALNYGYQTNAIYSCSWGPPDDGKSMEAPGRLIQQAMLNGVQKGRQGKGSIFVFASGNGGGVDDQCNFDGYTNSLMSITVGAIDRKNLHPFYSEACAANMVVTYSSGSGDNIHTTDVGKNKCTDRHGGTSAAAPIAAAVFALVLEARPDLTWRDIQHLVVQTAVQINPTDPDWQMTAVGRYFNHKYGFGKLDAWAIVNKAKTWELVKPQAWYATHEVQAGLDLTPQGVTSTIEITAEDLERHNFESLEHITVTVHISHQRRGNIEVELDSPRGMKSILARPRRFDEATTGIPNWTFMTVKHWDEDPVGTWTLRVKDRQTNNKNGTFNSWSMHLWGSSIDADKAKPYALPSPYQPGVPEEDEDPVDEPTATSDDPSKAYPKPTEHLPDDHADANGEATEPFGEPTSTPTSPAEVVPTPEEDIELPTPTPTLPSVDDEMLPVEDEDIGYTAPAAGTTSIADDADEYYENTPGYLTGVKNLLGSSTWMFVAGGTIVVFLAGVTAFFVLRRRPRLLGRGRGYDFAPQTDEEDGLPMSAMDRNRLSLGPGSARTRELYDAFRLDSDEEDESDDEGRVKVRVRDDVAYNDDAMRSFHDDPAQPLAVREESKLDEKPFRD
ncbi:kexin [Pseudohyphozyma bogoriensis]|nr:kexin [Pseudohyphozyma bogoriensis]